MLAKVRGMRLSVCVVVAALVALSLILPLFFAGTNLSQNVLVDWLVSTNSREYLRYGWAPDPEKVGDGNILNEFCHPLKVYVYPMPRRFHLGMLKGSTIDSDLLWGDDEPVPPWPRRSGLKKQHNVEYWLLADLLDNRRRVPGERAAVRVKHPEQADLFFVPFLSSLSFNEHGRTMRDPAAEKDKHLQEETVKYLLNSEWWQRSGGRDHIIPAHHPNAFRYHRNLLNASIFVVADFGRFSKDVSDLRKDVVAPYTHLVPSYTKDDGADPFEERKLLLYFQGRIKRKSVGVVRSQLATLLQNKSNVHFEGSVATVAGLEQSSRGMRFSKFCLHPAGDTPSSCRLFDAIVSHCVPVVVSNYIELPFEDELNYSSFSLFFSVEEAIQPGFLLERLENVTKGEWMKLWQKCKEVAHHFEYEEIFSRKDDAVNMIWKQLKRKVPFIKLVIHRKQRLRISDWWR